MKIPAARLAELLGALALVVTLGALLATFWDIGREAFVSYGAPLVHDQLGVDIVAPAKPMSKSMTLIVRATPSGAGIRVDGDERG